MPKVEAELHVLCPASAVEDYQRGFMFSDVVVERAQDPMCITIRGERAEVLKCLMTDFAMDKEEAEEWELVELR